MKKLIFLVWILTLAACSGKKTTPVSKDDDVDLNDYFIAERYENNYVEDDYEDYYIIQESYADRPVEDEDGYRYNPLFYSGYLSARASASQGSYPAGNLLDHTWRSWAVRGGSGESFTIEKNERYLSHDSRPMTIAGFALKNGYGHLDHYSANNRVKSFKIYADGNYTETIPIKDSISFEQYYFEEPVEIKSIRFVIDDVYPGTTHNETCVAEIALIEHWVSDRRFYDNILFWIDHREDSSSQYENNRRDMVSVSDADSLLLKYYLPYDIPDYFYDYVWNEEKRTNIRYDVTTKVALLNGQSSLKLNDNLPRLDGATAMYPLYSSFVRAVYPEIILKDSYLTSLHSWAYFPSETLLRQRHWDTWFPYDEEDREFGSIVQCNTTSEAFKRLIDGEVDIIFCYEPSQAEINAAAEKGLQFSLTPIAKDAFVFIVNNKNVLNNITQRQIRDIYSGRVTNWKTISGVDEPVIAYQRRENSGSQTTLLSLMKGEKLMDPILDGERVSGGMFSSIRKITSDYYNYNSAIGYTFLFYLTQMAGDSGVKVLSLDGIAPTRQTIQNNRYPFVQTVYAITTGNESDNTRRFITWILSAQGQELVAKTGYTPVR